MTSVDATLATALPDMDPNSAEDTMAIIAEPPRL
ncbi:hypothetical protein GGE09_004502 [Roseobacter sp. N2S]|jgi:hypothetical protein|nr:hypothetical protein [Roseobacter sp. N2S]